jgi:hypothetical protein
VPDWTSIRESLLRSLAEMSALFKPRRSKTGTGKDWAKIADRRSSPTVVRLRAGLFVRYSAATGAKEFDTFLRDAKTWAAFEHAVLPELANFAFIDKGRRSAVSDQAVLAAAMYHIWTVTDLGLDMNGRPTTIAVIGELAHYLCSVYETTRVDRRNGKRDWFGLNSTR